MFGVSVAFLGNREILHTRNPFGVLKRFCKRAEKYGTDIREIIALCGWKIKLFVVFDNGQAGLYEGGRKTVLRKISQYDSPVDHIQIIA